MLVSLYWSSGVDERVYIDGERVVTISPERARGELGRRDIGWVSYILPPLDGDVARFNGAVQRHSRLRSPSPETDETREGWKVRDGGDGGGEDNDRRGRRMRSRSPDNDSTGQPWRVRNGYAYDIPEDGGDYNHRRGWHEDEERGSSRARSPAPRIDTRKHKRQDIHKHNSSRPRRTGPPDWATPPRRGGKVLSPFLSPHRFSTTCKDPSSSSDDKSTGRAANVWDESAHDASLRHGRGEYNHGQGIANDDRGALPPGMDNNNTRREHEPFHNEHPPW